MTIARPAPAWIVAQPIAHRGFHDRAAGRIENTLSAAKAAIARGFAIECDVQRTADGAAIVFHDFDLGRLTGRSGRVDEHGAGFCAMLPLLDSSDRVPSFEDLLDTVAGAVPLICEIKSRFDGDMRLADRVADLALAYRGPLAIKSFDPAVIRQLRARRTGLPLGIVAEAAYDDPEWADLPPELRRDLAQVLHFGETRPDFLSYHVGDLPHAVPFLCRSVLGIPVMAWTVRTPEQRGHAQDWADQMVFEGFAP